jgi:hypothetical protein
MSQSATKWVPCPDCHETDGTHGPGCPNDPQLAERAHAGIPMDLYHRWPGASNSRLSKLRRSPAHLKAYLEEPPEERSALIIGRARTRRSSSPTRSTACSRSPSSAPRQEGRWHALHERRDGAARAERVALRRPPEGRDAYDYSTTQFVLPEADYIAVPRIRDAVFRHSRRRAPARRRRGEVELSLLWDDADRGVRCKDADGSASRRTSRAARSSTSRRRATRARASSSAPSSRTATTGRRRSTSTPPPRSGSTPSTSSSSPWRRSRRSRSASTG